MSDAQVLDVLLGAFTIATKIAGPILLAALIIGVAISILQTITQIQEMTLTFVPKLAASVAIILLGGNWMIRELVAWVQGLWQTIATL